LGWLGIPRPQGQLPIAHSRLVIHIDGGMGSQPGHAAPPLLRLVVEGYVAVAVLRPHALTAGGHGPRLRFPAAGGVVQPNQVDGAVELDAREARRRADLDGSSSFP